MIVLSDVTKAHIRSQNDLGAFADKLGVTVQTLYNILKDDTNVSSKTIERLLEETGFSFDKAFHIKVGD